MCAQASTRTPFQSGNKDQNSPGGSKPTIPPCKLNSLVLQRDTLREKLRAGGREQKALVVTAPQQPGGASSSGHPPDPAQGRLLHPQPHPARRPRMQPENAEKPPKPPACNKHAVGWDPAAEAVGMNPKAAAGRRPATDTALLLPAGAGPPSPPVLRPRTRRQPGDEAEALSLRAGLALPLGRIGGVLGDGRSSCIASLPLTPMGRGFLSRAPWFGAQILGLCWGGAAREPRLRRLPSGVSALRRHHVNGNHYHPRDHTHAHTRSVHSSPHYPAEREPGPVVSAGLTSVSERRAAAICSLLCIFSVTPGLPASCQGGPAVGISLPAPPAPLPVPIFSASSPNQVETPLPERGRRR